MSTEDRNDLEESTAYTLYEVSSDLPITRTDKQMPYRDDAPAVQVLIKKSVPNELAAALLEQLIRKLVDREDGSE